MIFLVDKLMSFQGISVNQLIFVIHPCVLSEKSVSS